MANLLTKRDLSRVYFLRVLGFVTLGALLVRLALFDFPRPTPGFHGHGYCYLWETDLVAAHAISDGLIGLSYIAISVTLVHLVRRAKDHLPFSWVFVSFGIFIIACGSTHLMDIWTLWTPVFWLAADIKIITAVASVATAGVLPPLVPRVLHLIEAANVSEDRRIALHKAEEANRAKEAFLSTVSHELRTPLNAVAGWVQMLKRAPEDAALVARGLEVIERNARSQAMLINDLLDVSRITSGMLRLDVETVDLVQIARDAADVLAPAAAAKQLDLAVEPTVDRLELKADPRRLKQVLWNLLSNAVKFTPSGGFVRVTVSHTRSSAIVEVQDSGEGIDPAFAPRLFDRFSQADSSATRRHQGLGLGLSISRQLVELHGGTLTASSRGHGQGATFRVELPLPEA